MSYETTKLDLQYMNKQMKYINIETYLKNLISAFKVATIAALLYCTVQ